MKSLDDGLAAGCAACTIYAADILSTLDYGLASLSTMKDLQDITRTVNDWHGSVRFVCAELEAMVMTLAGHRRSYFDMVGRRSMEVLTRPRFNIYRGVANASYVTPSVLFKL